MPDYWLRQTKDKPLFPDIIWSRPENRLSAGKLLIIGGNVHSFQAPAEAYTQALISQVGEARVMLPDSLQKSVGRTIEAGNYAPSTPSGSFARLSLNELLAASQWPDGVILAGDFGRNSETAIVLEQYISKYAGQLTITHDALDYFTKSPENLLNRPETLAVITMAQLQKMGVAVGFTHAFTFDMEVTRLVEALHVFTKLYSINLILKLGLNIIVASGGKISSTKIEEDIKIWRVRTATSAAVWWLQNPTQTFESLTSSLSTKS